MENKYYKTIFICITISSLIVYCFSNHEKQIAQAEQKEQVERLLKQNDAVEFTDSINYEYSYLLSQKYKGKSVLFKNVYMQDLFEENEKVFLISEFGFRYYLKTEIPQNQIEKISKCKVKADVIIKTLGIKRFDLQLDIINGEDGDDKFWIIPNMDDAYLINGELIYLNCKDSKR